MMWDDLVAIVAMICIFIGSPLAAGWMRRNRGISAADRAMIESLRADTQRLEQRVISLERALLDAETAAPDRSMRV